MKTCTRCEITKELASFGKNKYEPDGLRAWCRSCYNAYMRTYYSKNSEPIKQRSQSYFEANRDEQNEKRRQRRLCNLEKERQNSRNWAARNPDKARAYKSKNRAKRKTAKLIGAVTGSDIKKLLMSKNCFYCSASSKLTIDHVVPLARGGAHSIGNLVAACVQCNSSKGSKLLIEWRAYRSKIEV